MAKTFTYKRLRKLLLDIGFMAYEVEDSHVRYDHDESNTVLLFGIHLPSEQVRPVDQITTRRMLDEKGLLDASEFDQIALGVRQRTTRPSGAG